MLAKRVAASLILAAVGLPAIIYGGAFYSLLITLFLSVAAWEYDRLFRAVNLKSGTWLLVGGVLILVLVRAFTPDYSMVVFSSLILLAMTFHLINYEKGRDQAAVDFGVTIAGIVYLGWIGAYLIDLRNLPNGLGWLLLVLPSVWVADSGAYFIGRRFGRRALSPRLSPKKTWEGYWGGVVVGTLAGVLFAWLWQRYGGLNVSLIEGALLGLMLSTLTTLGDLGESLFKRQGKIKDSSNIIPGHGGVFDRIDSWLWAGVLGYHFILWVLI